MDSSLESMRNDIHDALDDVNSPRVSPDVRAQALTKLEAILAAASISKDTTQFDDILALQYTFECNIPSRLLPWISTCSPKLECLSGRAQSSEEEKHEASELSSQLLPALSIIQGIALSHPPSKAFLGRRRNLEILIDLLLASRHVSSPSPTTPTTKNPGQQIFLTSAVLDTLLCILVDSCSSLRLFEECNGVQAIVKILKRLVTPREVRMKCMEFLYFYLMDETTTDIQQSLTESTPPSTAPTTPYRPSQTRKKKPFINNTPSRPISRYGSSTYEFSSSSAGITTGSGSGTESSLGSGTFNPAEFTATSSRSVSSSSATSFTSTISTSSTGTTSTAPSSASSSPKKHSSMKLPTTPPGSPPLQPAFEPKTPSQKPRLPLNVPRTQPKQAQARALMMLKKDVDFVPQSPHRGGYGHGREDSFSGEGSLGSGGGIKKHMRVRSGLGLNGDGEPSQRVPQSNAKTTDQKKKLLGTMLGNVDALVEGVSKAGIWGLG